MKKKEKSVGEPGKVAGSFAWLYLVILYISLVIGDAAFAINESMTLRIIICMIGVFLGIWCATRYAVSRYICLKNLQDAIRTYLNIVIIAIAFISLFYLLFALKSNVNKIKDSPEYKYVSLYLSQETADEIVGEAEKEARGKFFMLWAGIVVASGISIPLQKKRIAKYCVEDMPEQNIREDNMEQEKSDENKV